MDEGCFVVTAFRKFVLILGAFVRFAVNSEGFAVPSKLPFGGAPNGRWKTVYGCGIVFRNV